MKAIEKMASAKVKWTSELGDLKKGKIPRPGTISNRLHDRMRIKRVAAKGKISSVFFLSPVIPSNKSKIDSNIHSNKFCTFPGTISFFLNAKRKKAIIKNVKTIAITKVLVKFIPKKLKTGSPVKAMCIFIS